MYPILRIGDAATSRPEAPMAAEGLDVEEHGATMLHRRERGRVLGESFKGSAPTRPAEGPSRSRGRVRAGAPVDHISS
jgi:hypothetical protein